MKHFCISELMCRYGHCAWRVSLCLLIGLLATAYAEAVTKAPVSAQATGGPMTYTQARQKLVEMWNNRGPAEKGEEVDHLRISFTGKNILELHMRNIYTRSGNQYPFDYRYDLAAMSDPYIKGRDFWHNIDYFMVLVDQGCIGNSIARNGGHTCTVEWHTRQEAETFAYLLSMLKQHAMQEKEKFAAEPALFADFQEKAKTWRALAVKPPLPETVQRCRIMAEDAFKNRDFEKAAEYYEQGLQIEPLWPQGRHNAAWLYAELKDYQSAVLHIKRYLEVAPDAANAKQARDMLYLWEGKAAEAQARSGMSGTGGAGEPAPPPVKRSK